MLSFKFHKGYKGFYLLENNKFKKPFQRLNVEETLENLSKDNIKVEFKEDEIITFGKQYASFGEKKEEAVVKQKSAPKKIEKVVEKNSFEDEFLATRIAGLVPKLIIDKVNKVITTNEKIAKKPSTVWPIIETVINTDALLKVKARKLFYYKDVELESFIKRYFENNILSEDLKTDIIKNYPVQYVEKNLPLDYKENEMLYVFYFIVVVELLSNLK